MGFLERVILTSGQDKEALLVQGGAGAQGGRGAAGRCPMQRLSITPQDPSASTAVDRSWFEDSCHSNVRDGRSHFPVGRACFPRYNRGSVLKKKKEKKEEKKTCFEREKQLVRHLALAFTCKGMRLIAPD